VRFDEGHVLVDADHPASGIFLVMHGVLLVETPAESYERGPGHVLGQWETLDGSEDVRVTAQSDVRLVAVSRADYEAALSG
jgi:CRP-like cAMP-binding protein